jgi:phage repressor protein C with HTH and peptisase S24 domain
MNSVVTERFIECHNKLLEDQLVRSSRQFAIKLDFLPQSLGEILKKRRDVTLELVRKAIETFEINPMFLFTGQGEMFNGCVQKPDSDILTIVTNDLGDEKIVHVPVSAQAGYGGQLHDPVFMEELPSFTLPGEKYKMGTYRCFDISGDSMEPTLFDGDQVVCSYIEKQYWDSLRDNYVYVIVSENDVVVKRAKNRIKDLLHLELFSDNNYYNPYIMQVEDIKEIWYVNVKISPFMPSPSHVRNALHHELNDLRNTMINQSSLIKNLNTTIESLMKQNGARL